MNKSRKGLSILLVPFMCLSLGASMDAHEVSAADNVLAAPVETLEELGGESALIIAESLLDSALLIPVEEKDSSTEENNPPVEEGCLTAEEDSVGSEVPAEIIVVTIPEEFPVQTDGTESGVFIDSVAFPDETFRVFVDENYDTADDNVLTAEEIALVVYMDCSSYGIESLQGIEYFTSLETLLCADNALSTLDVTACTALTYLECYDNQLTELSITGCDALCELDCSNNNLSALSLGGCTALTRLDVYGNTDISALDVSMCSALTYLDCSETALTALDVSQCAALETLYCQYIGLESLNISGCASLKKLYCDSNELAALDLTGCSGLETLYCGRNTLSELNLSDCTSLVYLSCHSNSLSVLDLTGCTALQTVYCYSNDITELNASGCESLLTLNCYSNSLAELDISDCVNLNTLRCNNNKLTALDVSACTELGYLDCSSNRLPWLSLDDNSKTHFIILGEQTASGKAEGTEPCTVNLASLVGEENIGRISDVIGGVYDAETGLVTMEQKLSSIRYTYDTGVEHAFLSVILNLTYPDGIVVTTEDGLTWTIVGDTLIISGSGAMADYADEIESPAYAYRDSIKKIIIEDGVTYVGALSLCGTVVEEITFADSVSAIGKYAFMNSDSMEIASIPGTVTTIGKNAFCECDSLEVIELGEGVTSVASYAFGYNDSIRELYLPLSLEAVENGVFYSTTASVETIYYAGTSSQWMQLPIGSGNKPLTGAEVICLGEKLRGDVNGDGRVNDADPLLLLEYIVGNTDAVAGETDFDGSGTTDVRDALRLVRYLAGDENALD